MRLRTRTIADIRLSERDSKKLRRGYRIYKSANGTPCCIYINGTNRKKEREIAKLKARIKQLQTQLEK